MKIAKKIKAWAVIFPESKYIYHTLSSDLSNLQQLAIFLDKNGAESWRERNCKEECYEPKIIPCEITLTPPKKHKRLINRYGKKD